MKVKIILALLILSITLNAQSPKLCNKIYEKPDTLAKYGDDKSALRQYAQAKIIPILGNCIKQKMEFVNSLDIKFTINEKGIVIAVDFLKPVLSNYCREKLTAEILNMKDWKPGIVNEQKICSTFIYSIAGIKWQ